MTSFVLLWCLTPLLNIGKRTADGAQRMEPCGENEQFIGILIDIVSDDVEGFSKTID